MPISEAKRKVAQAISLQRDFQSRLMRVCTGMIECFGSFASPGRNEFRLQADSLRHLRYGSLREARN